MQSLQAKLKQLSRGQKILLLIGGLIFLCVCLCCPAGFFFSPSSNVEWTESIAGTELESIAESEFESIAEVAPPAAPPTLAPPSKLDVSNLHVEYILDASAIMNKPLTEGRSKIEVAAEQIRTTLDGPHPGTNLGLRVYGHRYAREDAAGSCQDTELVVPVGRGNQEAIVGWLQETPAAQGLTSLTTSLEEASRDFSIDPDRLNAIILISGSGETCQRDPCALVNRWQIEGIPISVHAVGLQVEEAARQQLQCITQAAGGTYYDASTAADLAHALAQIQQTLKREEIVIPAAVAMMPTPTPTGPPTPTATRVVNTPEPGEASPPEAEPSGDEPIPTFTPIPLVPPGSLPPDMRLAFHSHYDDGSGGEIYTANTDGTQPVNLTNLPGSDDIGPAWSPDGRRIAFASTRDDPERANCDQLLSGLDQNLCNYEIYIINANGPNLVRLTNHPAVDSKPVWSPDGSRIAFHSTRDGNDELYVINADGTNLLNLTNHPAGDYGAVWSPDGTQVAFTSLRDEPDPENCNQRCNTEIYRINADGSDLRNLTNHPAGDTDPAWSPDGTRLAFSTTRDDATTEPGLARRAQNCEIYLINSDGSSPTRLTNLTFCEHSPAWSPDGRQLIFQSWSKADDESNPDSMIYPCTPTCLISEPGSQAPIDQNGLTCLPGPGSTAGSVWAPDGRHLAFSSCQLPHNLYILDLAGRTVWRLTDAPFLESWGGYTQPRWAPQ